MLKKEFSSFIADGKCFEYEEDVDDKELYATAPLHPVQGPMCDYNNGYDQELLVCFFEMSYHELTHHVKNVQTY